MLEEILLFRSTYSEQLLLDTILIEVQSSSSPAEMEKASFAAYRRTLITDSQTPPSTGSIHPHQPIQWVVFWAKIGASPGTVGRSLWRLLCRNGSTPVKITPIFPWKIHRRTGVSRDSLCHHELWAPGGDGATKAEGVVLQVRRAPLGTGVPASSASLDRRETSARPSTMPALLQVAQGKPGARQNRRQVWDVPWSSCHHPAQGMGGAAVPLHLHYNQTYQRSNVTTTSVNKVGQSQPWRKQEPSHQL